MATPTGTQKPVKLYGLQWTYYAEAYDSKTMEQIMYDYSGEVEVDGMKRGVELRQENLVVTNLKIYNRKGRIKRTLGGEGGYKDAGFSVVKDEKDELDYYELSEGDGIAYSVRFHVDGAEAGKTILLATPVFDDITIFYSEAIKVITYLEEIK